MLLEVALDTATKPIRDKDHPMVPLTKESIHGTEKFLREFPAAKIVVIIDTHCLDNGSFAYKGDSPGTYQGCGLLEVSLTHKVNLPPPTPVQILQDCVPPVVFQYLSNANNTPVHKHKSLIINLSCGPSISEPISRHSLLQGYASLSINQCLVF